MPRTRDQDKFGKINYDSGKTLTIARSNVNGFGNTQTRQRPAYRRIGILGGIGPESTMIYYQYIVREHYTQYGNLQYPEILIFNANYQDYEECLCQGQWDTIITMVTQALKSLQKAGARYGLIACNTLHIVFDEIRIRSPIPLVSIVEATIEAIQQQGIKKVGILGTAFTMKSGVYSKNLETRSIETLVPSEEERLFVDEVIRKELVRGVIRAKSRRRFVKIIDEMVSLGAEGVILGCTEIPLLVNQSDCQVRLFDTALIHVQKALAYSTAPAL